MNVRNAESAWLLGYSRFKAWQTKFMQEWAGPYMDQQVIMMWDSIPVEVKDRLRQMKPKEFAEFDRRIGAIRQGSGS